MTHLNQEQKQSYNENGFIIIRGLLTPQEISQIQKMKTRIDDEVKDCTADFRKGEASFNFERIKAVSYNSEQAEIRKGILRKIQEVYFLEPTFKDICVNDKVLDIVESIIGETIYYHSSKLMYKGPGGREKPWHQDFAYWKIQNGKQVTVWYAIDEATKENGCVEVIPASHKKGLLPHFGPELQFKLEDHFKEKDIVYAEMKPGDVLFFDVLTCHGSQPNKSKNPRLSCIIDFQDRLNGDLSTEHIVKKLLRSPVTA